MVDGALQRQCDELRAEVASLKEQNSNVTGNYLTLLAEPCIYCGQAEYEKKEAEARLRELKTACGELDGNHHEHIGRVLVDETAYNTIIELLEPDTQE